MQNPGTVYSCTIIRQWDIESLKSLLVIAISSLDQDQKYNMSDQGLTACEGLESDLYIFNGMEGFEECGSNDSALVALIDDLHDDTLFSLLDNNLFGNELCGSPFEEDKNFQSANERLPENERPLDMPVCCDSDKLHAQNVQMVNSFLTRDSSTCAKKYKSVERECFSDDKKLKRVRTDGVHEKMTKKVKLENSSVSQVSNTALTWVMHDHCYVSTREDLHLAHNSSTNSDEEASNEESSSSDTGKEYSLLVAFHMY